MHRLALYAQPSAAENEARTEFYCRLSSAIKALWPACTVELFGSSAAGLGLFNSDIDLCVHGACGTSPIEALNAILMHQWSTWFYARPALEMVLHARVPIITVSASPLLSADVSFSCLGHADRIISVSQSKQFLQSCVQTSAAFRPTAIVLKLFFHSRDLDKTFHGGLGSFKVCMWPGGSLVRMVWRIPSVHGPADP